MRSSYELNIGVIRFDKNGQDHFLVSLPMLHVRKPATITRSILLRKDWHVDLRIEDSSQKLASDLYFPLGSSILAIFGCDDIRTAGDLEDAGVEPSPNPATTTLALAAGCCGPPWPQDRFHWITRGLDPRGQGEGHRRRCCGARRAQAEEK